MRFSVGSDCFPPSSSAVIEIPLLYLQQIRDEAEHLGLLLAQGPEEAGPASLEPHLVLTGCGTPLGAWLGPLLRSWHRCWKGNVLRSGTDPSRSPPGSPDALRQQAANVKRRLLRTRNENTENMGRPPTLSDVRNTKVQVGITFEKTMRC